MKRAAVVGTGIAGMAAGYFLRNQFQVTFYEKNERPGGHTNTVFVKEKGRDLPIDTGFIVYNEVTYPNLIKFFDKLGVATMPADMSFSVRHEPLGLEYCGTGWNGIFAQRRNLFNPRFWKLLLRINRFNQECLEILNRPEYEFMSLRDYVEEKNFGRDFLDHYLVPMSSAVWSTPPDLMLDFPASTLVRFFKNHGLLGMHGHLQWRTVCGGSRMYRDKVLSMFAGNVFLSNPVTAIVRKGTQVEVADALGRKEIYDHVILAGHADEMLAVLKDASPLEKSLLEKFKYQKNHAVLHTDASVMPRTRTAWSSWNYRVLRGKNGELVPSTAYWMNGLQKVSEEKNYFVSINDPGSIDPKTILWKTDYMHPLFDTAAVRAQKELPQLNQDGRVFFCGSYFKYGFHEDAFTAALEAVRPLLDGDPWS